MKPCFSRMALILTVASLISLPAFAGATTYKIDPRHSSAQFAVTHLMISTVRGEFHAVNGIVTVASGPAPLPLTVYAFTLIV